MSKVHSVKIYAKLDCSRCLEKIRKAICSVCVCEIHSETFDEKANVITITGTFDPKKIMKKICKKARKCILSFEVSEVSPPAPSKEDKVEKKEKEISKKGKKELPSAEVMRPLVMVVVPPEPPRSPPRPPAPAPKPQKEVVAYAPVLVGAPTGWCHCGPCHHGHCCQHFRLRHETGPCSCGCRDKSDLCSGPSQRYPKECVLFSEEDSTCTTM